MEKEHDKTHWGIESVISNLQNSVLSVRMTERAKSITVKCPTCLKNNPMNRKGHLLEQLTGNSPGDYWQIDFSELPRQKKVFWYR